MTEAVKDDIRLVEEVIDLSLDEENRDIACNITGLVRNNSSNL